MAKPELSWGDDLLGRKENGLFLYKLVMQRYKSYHSAPGSPAMCFALDADWGAGKTFFVDRWSNDVSNCEHPTIHFDAWANDLSDEPLVGFLSTLRNELKPWLDQRPKIEGLKEAVGARLDGMVKQAGKALIPAGVAVLKGVSQRYLGSAVEEIAELWRESDGPTSEAEAVTPDQQQQAEKKADEKTEALITKTVEKYLETVMKSHADKQQAISLLKKNIEELVDFLVEKQVISAPMFIFVDELDRCRPDYAIKLLEGIKHLFNARGVCFVVSTNLQQLSSAVKAVYGSEFDAYRYLKKFFSFEYMLPAPSSYDFCLSMVRNSNIVQSINNAGITIELGLPRSMTQDVGLATCLNIIATAMDLNLRSQRQVFEHAEAALAGYSGRTTFVAIYHFFLAAVLHKGVSLYDELFNSDGISTGVLPARLRTHAHKFSLTRRNDGRSEKFEVDLRDVLKTLHEYASWTEERVVIERNNVENPEYPRNLLQRLLDNNWTQGDETYLYLAATGKMIRASGYVR